MGISVEAFVSVTLVGTKDCPPVTHRGSDRLDEDICYLANGKGCDDCSDGLVPGYYRCVKPDGGAAELYANNVYYAGYLNSLQELIQQILGGVKPASSKGVPFREHWILPEDGFLGPETARRLLEDYVAHEEKARVSFDEWNLKMYLDFKRLLSVAAGKGVVVFC